MALDVLPFFRQEQTILGSRGSTHESLSGATDETAEQDDGVHRPERRQTPRRRV